MNVSHLLCTFIMFMGIIEGRSFANHYSPGDSLVKKSSVLDGLRFLSSIQHDAYVNSIDENKDGFSFVDNDESSITSNQYGSEVKEARPNIVMSVLNDVKDSHLPSHIIMNEKDPKECIASEFNTSSIQQLKDEKKASKDDAHESKENDNVSDSTIEEQSSEKNDVNDELGALHSGQKIEEDELQNGDSTSKNKNVKEEHESKEVADSLNDSEATSKVDSSKDHDKAHNDTSEISSNEKDSTSDVDVSNKVDDDLEGDALDDNTLGEADKELELSNDNGESDAELESKALDEMEGDDKHKSEKEVSKKIDHSESVDSHETKKEEEKSDNLSVTTTNNDVVSVESKKDLVDASIIPNCEELDKDDGAADVFKEDGVTEKTEEQKVNTEKANDNSNEAEQDDEVSLNEGDDEDYNFDDIGEDMEGEYDE